MVRTCDYPGCSNRDVSESPHNFHRFPVTDVSLRQLWLVALGFHVDTRLPKMKKLRVCGAHFDEDDYVPPRPGQRKRRVLKRCAVPAPQTEELSAVMDGPQIQARISGVQPETCTTSVMRPPLLHVVDEEAILQLMKSCPMCNKACRCAKHTRSPYIIIYQSCYFCNYQRKWASQPEALNMNIQKVHTHNPRRNLSQRRRRL